MLSKVTSFALAGLEGVPVEVETDIQSGLPGGQLRGAVPADQGGDVAGGDAEHEGGGGGGHGVLEGGFVGEGDVPPVEVSADADDGLAGGGTDDEVL